MSSKQSQLEHSALYRKYRPQGFNDVAGQDHVVNVLKGAIAEGKIAHAYLFSGSRGIGKTSIARIFAKQLGTSDNDLYEIDAASQTSVDDIRALNEAVLTLPFDSKYKVYILDEVHMLSKSAFNALLKTLEEPPAHVIFILATTELHKVPDTIVSRCQTFSFNKPTLTILKDLISSTAKEEGFSLEISASELIATLAEGSFRDALGILQKILSIANTKKITVGEVEMITGAPHASLINDFIDAIASGDRIAALEVIQRISETSINVSTFIKLSLQKVRHILLSRFVPAYVKDLQDTLSQEDYMFISSRAKDMNKKLTSDVLVELINAHEAVASAYIPELPLEIAVMRLLDNEA